MKRQPAWLALGLMLFVVVACNLGRRSTNVSTNNTNATANSSAETSSTSTGVLSEVHMARDDGRGDPGEQASTFNAEDRTIHCVTRLKDPKSGTKMKFSWFVVESQEIKNDKLKEIDYTTRGREDVVHGHLTAPRDWPVGKYKVEVYVNGNLEETVHFNVE